MTSNSIPREVAQAPRKPAASVQRPREACAVARVGWGTGGSAPAGTTRGRQRPPPAATAATGSGQEGWAGLTFTLPAFPLVAWLAQAFVGLGCVLADGVDVAVVRALRALVHVDWPCVGGVGETLVRCGLGSRHRTVGQRAPSASCLSIHHQGD